MKAEADKLALGPGSMASTNVYKILAGCIVPRPIGFFSTVGADGVFNAAPFSFFNGISHAPPLVCASIARIYETGRTKDTLANVLHTRDFVVNIVDEDLARAQDLCSETYPRRWTRSPWRGSRRSPAASCARRASPNRR